MANDNVKIIVQEVDETQPKGSGSSSDVVYVPGLAVDKWVIGEDKNGHPLYKQVNTVDDYGNLIPLYEYTDKNGEKKRKGISVSETVPTGYTRAVDAEGRAAYETADWAPIKNVPMLCTTVEEFENYFGPEPYVLTSNDMTYSKLGETYHAGDYDKSYIYAKELLNAGMSVIYENIAEDAEIFNSASVSHLGVASELIDNNDNTFVYNSSPDNKDAKEYLFVFNLDNFSAKGSHTITILYDLPSKASISCQIGNILCNQNNEEDIENNPFTIDNVKHTIKWENIPDSILNFAQFTLPITIQYSGNKSEAFPISIKVLDGDVIVPNIKVGTSKIAYLYSRLPERLDRIEDKSEYSLKYITSGGYPTFVVDNESLADALIDCAAQRGDAVALVDHEDNPAAPLNYLDEGSVYFKVNKHFGNGGTNNEFGAMFTPWGRYSCTTISDVNRMSQLMPASFGYLMCMAAAIKTSPNWLAMAGVSRGLVPGLKSLHTDTTLTNVIAENYQPKYGKESNKVSVNAITNIKPYGLTIWGNRTLDNVAEKGTKALNFLNTRNMVSDIKKLAYSTAKALMFEQDSDTLWLRFKSGISPLLEQLKVGCGISDYKLIRGKTKYNGQALTRGEMAAVIKIYPLYAVEYFEITVVLADNDVSVQ